MTMPTHLTTLSINGQQSSAYKSTADLGIVRELYSPDASPAGAYIHIPFCFHKCHYCDFYSLVENRGREAAFVARLVDELRIIGGYLKQPLRTIFFGGGTPTLLETSLWQDLLRAINQHLPIAQNAEITVEANPETVRPDLMDLLAKGGINRISIGAQSFQPDHLKALERWHDPENVKRAIVLAQESGITNINIDLIFAIPGQTLNDWLTDLDTAISLSPSHLSCYGLTYEPNTPLTEKLRQGRIIRVDEDLEAEMYEATRKKLTEAGYEQYEISNWAKPHYQCQHNLMYWNNKNWWAFGPSASGHINGLRWKNVPHLGEYLKATDLPSIIDVEKLDEDGQVGEALMLGLRLTQGIKLIDLDALLLKGKQGKERLCVIDQHTQSGLLEKTADRIRFTAKGQLLADSVLSDLI
ncbi:MAG: radical SAM family heme chaperone HemW [Planctomycetes bacterium]|nr:radical SAM family heme chaperone HemW [Planctomycetota bacterium]